MMTYEKKIDDCNFETMLKVNSKFQYEKKKKSIFDESLFCILTLFSLILEKLCECSYFYVIEIAKKILTSVGMFFLFLSGA